MGAINENVLTIIYDGECILCRNCTTALRLKKSVGDFETIDARQANNPAVIFVKEKGYDLDQGVVVAYQGKYYAGADAMHFLSLLCSDVNWINRMAGCVFRHRHLTFMLYPFFRCMRGFWLWICGVPWMSASEESNSKKANSQKTNLKENDLEKQPKTFFSDVFVNNAADVSAVFKKRYQNRYFSNDEVVMHGELKIRFTHLYRILLPLFNLAGTLVPYEGEHVKTTVRLCSSTSSNKVSMIRDFVFADGKKCQFKSVIMNISKNKFVEITRFNLAWKFCFTVSDDSVIMQHRGYGIMIGRRCLPLPGLAFLVGVPYAKEQAINNDEFVMQLRLAYPRLFFCGAKLFTYSGTFKLK